MANLPETAVWEAGIYQLEETDVVQGGANGIDNLQAKQLVNRSLYLKNLVDALGTGKLAISALATQVQAQAGTDNSTWMSPLRVAQAIAALATVIQATDTVAGKVELATAAETVTGTDTVRATHPAGVKAAIEAAIAAVVASSPATLNTLNELAAALGNDPNFATSITALIAGKQAADNTLTALSGLTTAANQMPYSTGADAFAMTALTTFARTLLDDADAATMRGTLGLGAAAIAAIGSAANQVAAGDHTHTGYQAADNTLSALSGLAAAANQIIYSTGADAFSMTALSAFMRSMLDAPDAASVRTTLALTTGLYVSNGANSVLKLPDWLGGWIIQTGTTPAIAQGSEVSVTLPLAMPNAILGVAVNGIQTAAAGGSNTAYWDKAASTNAVLVFGNDDNGNSQAIQASFIVIGH